MPQFDTVIRGGTVVDGTRLPRVRADVGIKHGRVAKIGRIAAGAGARELDAGRSSRPASSTCTATTTRRSTGTRTARSRAGTA